MLADDVALHRPGAATDGERLGEQEPVVPYGVDARHEVGRERSRSVRSVARRQAARRPRPGEHPVGAAQVLAQPHDVLAVLVGEHLLHRRVRTGRTAGQPLTLSHPQLDEAQHLAFHVGPRGAGV